MTNVLFGMQWVWLHVAFVTAVFWVLTFRPERVGNLGLLRGACVVFALSLVLPGAVLVIPDPTPATRGGLGGAPSATAAVASAKYIASLLGACSPVLFSIAYVMAVFSLRTQTDSQCP